MSLSRLIVGIDFGTTYSGIVFSESTRGQALAVRSWPGSRHTECQVPTTLSYEQNRILWGYEANAQLSEVNVWKWFKICMDVPHEHIPPGSLPDNKTAEDLIRDYLSKMREHFHSNKAGAEVFRALRNFRGQEANIEYVFTVPASWNDNVKVKFINIAKSAGFYGRISTISEPEAAAIYTIKEASDGGDVRRGDIVLVCDAGGGTVDTAGFRVEFAEADVHLRSTSLHLADGRSGSAHIDKKFKEQLQNDFRRSGRTLNPQTLNKALEEFRIKKEEFGSEDSGTGDYHIFENGFYTLTRAKMQSYFDELIPFIEELLDRQFEMHRSKGLQIQHLFLVGGLGASPYIARHFKRWAQQRGIFFPEILHAQQAVAEGAVRSKLQESRGRAAVTTRLSPAHYGIVVEQAFNESNPYHIPSCKVRDPVTKEFKASNQILWLLDKGMEVHVSAPPRYHNLLRKILKKDTKDPDKMKAQLTFVKCDTDRRPMAMHQPGVDKLCTMGYDLSKVDAEKHFDKEKVKSDSKLRFFKEDSYHVPLQIWTIVGAGIVKWQLHCRGNNISQEAQVNLHYRSA